jgi:hypothetical protein
MNNTMLPDQQFSVGGHVRPQLILPNMPATTPSPLLSSTGTNMDPFTNLQQLQQMYVYQQQQLQRNLNNNFNQQINNLFQPRSRVALDDITRRQVMQGEYTPDQIHLTDDIPENERTTLMMRNIPNKYTQTTLLQLFTREGNFVDGFDFFYLPIDFRSKSNMGYCFINFVCPEDARKFKAHFTIFVIGNLIVQNVQKYYGLFHFKD